MGREFQSRRQGSPKAARPSKAAVKTLRQPLVAQPAKGPGTPVFLQSGWPAPKPDSAAQTADADTEAQAQSAPEAVPVEPEAVPDTGQDAGTTEQAVGEGLSEGASDPVPGEAGAADAAPAPADGPSEGVAEATAAAVAKPAAMSPAPEPASNALDLPPLAVVELGLPQTPPVAAPPKGVVARSQDILKETGLTPEVHHARVQQALSRVTEAAGQAQREVVWRVQGLAQDTRISMEELAAEIPGVVAGALAWLGREMDAAETQIRAAAKAQIDHIHTHKAKSGEELRKNQNRVATEVREILLKDNEPLRQADRLIQQRFGGYVRQAQGQVRQLPATGKVQPLPKPEGTDLAPPDKGKVPPGKTPPGKTPGAASAGGSSARTVPQADKSLDKTLNTLKSANRIGTYQEFRVRPTKTAMVTDQTSALQKQVNTWVKQLGDKGLAAQFVIGALGLAAPAAKTKAALAKDKAKRDSKTLGAEGDKLEDATAQAKKIIEDKRDGTCEHLRETLKPKLEEGLRKTGRQIEQGLRQQARAAEHGLRSGVPGMADSYRQLVARLGPLVPPGQFLDARERAPRLQEALASVLNQRREQLAGAEAQAGEVLEQGKTARRQQGQALWKAARDSAGGVTDVFIATRFDFALFAAQQTGVFTAAARRAVAATQGYAERMAKALLKPGKPSEEALKNIDVGAVAMLNGMIGGEERVFVGAVQSFENGFLAPEGPLNQIKRQVTADLNKRTDRIKDALPEALLADDKESEVLVILGELPWPGAAALEEWYNGHSDTSLRTKLDDHLSGDDLSFALGLLSGSAKTRAKTRLAIARDSTHWLGPNRAAREAVLRSFSPEERALLDPAQVALTRRVLQGDLRGESLTISEAYLDDDPARALGARLKEHLDKARRKGDDAIRQAMGDIDGLIQQEFQFVHPDRLKAQSLTRVENLRDQALREFAALTAPDQRQAKDISLDDARQAFIDYATADRTVYEYQGGHAYHDGYAPPPRVRQVAVDPQVKAYVRAMVAHGPDSEQTWIAGAAYEVQRAERGGKPSETTQIRLTQALEDPEYYRVLRDWREADAAGKARLQPELDRKRRRHEARLEGLARALGASPEDLQAPGGAQSWVADKVGKVFARVDSEDARYGRELIEQGRASLVAGVRLSTRDSGTHEDLLKHTYTGRSKQEIAAARSEWRQRYHEDLDQMLGIKPRERSAADWALLAAAPIPALILQGGEVSGDLAHELEKLARGEPSSDLDKSGLAALDYDQQRLRGTGILGEAHMQGRAEQRVLDQRRSELGRLILDEAAKKDPALVQRLGDDPGAAFTADGRVRPAVAALAFNDKGEFLGDRTRLLDLSHEMGLAADSYKAEIDREEASWTRLITALAVAVSVLLLFIPGVNLVAAGVYTALIAGAATIAVKAGMRGGRYGWEEAVGDIAMTGVEAVTAGIGGAIGQGAKLAGAGAAALGKAGVLARMGAGLTSRFGVVGGAVVREGMTGAVSSAAQVAMQDETWKDGPGSGALRVLGGGVKGAAVAAVTAGVSEGLDRRLGKALDPGALTDPARLRGLQRAGRVLGPRGREVLKEGVSEAAGAVAGEGTAIMAELASGQYRGGLGEALNRMGQAGLRDLAGGTARAGMRTRNQRRYRELLGKAQEGGELRDSDLRALRLAGISAGELESRDGLGKVRGEVEAGRAALGALPTGLRSRLVGLDAASLRSLQAGLSRGELATPKARLAMIRGLKDKLPGLDPSALARELGAAQGQVRAELEQQARRDRKRRREARGRLLAGVEPQLRGLLEDLDLSGLERLPPAQQRQAAALLARGRIDPESARALGRALPDGEADTLLRQLHEAADQVALARTAEAELAARRRQAALAHLPEPLRPAFAALPDADLARLRRLAEQGGGRPAQREALFQSARRAVPELLRGDFEAALEAATGAARRRARREAQARRVERAMGLGHLPEPLRALLAALPEAALLELRLRAAQGAELDTDTRQRLLAAAARETPEADLGRLARAMEAAMTVEGPERAPRGDEAKALRSELVAEVPAALRSHLQEVPILVMKDAEFRRFTRSESGQAVTLIVHGQPVVVLREGADPAALREEGWHVLQAREPAWAKRVGALDERRLGEWDRLSVEVQMALVRNKLDIEIDAQQRRLAALSARLAGADGEQAAALGRQLELIGATLGNLRKLRGEAEGYTPARQRAMAAGLIPRPQWLDQPARLFMKTQADPATGPPTRPDLETIGRETGIDDPRLRGRIQTQLDKLSPAAAAEHLAHIKALAAGLDETGLQRLMEQAAAADDPAGVLLRARLDAIGGTKLLDKLQGYKDPAEAAQAQRTLARLLLDGGSEALAVIDLVKKLRSDFAVGRLAEAHQVLAMGLPRAQQSELLAVVAKPTAQRDSEHRYSVSDALARLARMLPPVPSPELAKMAVEVLRRVKQSEMEGLLSTMESLHRFARGIAKPSTLEGELFDALVGVMSTQRYYNEFMREAAPLLELLGKPSTDPAQAQRVADVLDYIRKAQGDHNELAQVAADLRAAGKALEGASDPARRFAEQHQSLTGEAKRLAGGDAWAARLGEEAGRWPDLAKAHPDFAKLLDAALPGVGEGLKTLLAGQPRQWFEHLATSKGATTHQQQLTLLKGLLAEVGSLGSEGQFKKLFRAIREATVDADLAGRKLDASDLEQTVARLRDQIKDRKQGDRGLLKDHLDALAEQDQRYRRMIKLAEELNALGIKGGLGEELGASAREIGAWKARRTEVLGEIALTDHMLGRDNGAWELALNFAKGTGFDQVWLRRENGQVVEYLIGEAKGPGAALGATDSKGPQMLRRWVEETIEDMWDRGLPLGDELLQAIADGKPPLRGLIVQATEQGAKLLDFPYSGGYGFAEHDRLIDELIRRYLASPKEAQSIPLDHPDLIDEDPL